MATPSHDGNPGYFYICLAFISYLRLSSSTSCLSFELGTCLKILLTLDPKFSTQVGYLERNLSRMEHYLPYSSELGQMGTDQQEHEQCLPSVQTRFQSSDTRTLIQMNYTQSRPWPQGENQSWGVCSQPPGSAMPYSYSYYSPRWDGLMLGTEEPTASQVSRFSAAARPYYTTPLGSVSPKVSITIAAFFTSILYTTGLSITYREALIRKLSQTGTKNLSLVHLHSALRIIIIPDN